MKASINFEDLDENNNMPIDSWIFFYFFFLLLNVDAH